MRGDDEQATEGLLWYVWLASIKMKAERIPQSVDYAELTLNRVWGIASEKGWGLGGQVTAGGQLYEVLTEKVIISEVGGIHKKTNFSKS